ncbi:MAG: acyltransferase [Spirochaetes bacterium GWC2_52_13]|nr:MAG: acyltransferase [Spirochaetes bacterium GWC2_52_13]OHD62010.1 MAG: acyltransferase [Spirochaetes bacterium GWF2_52_7]HCG64367.1 membrane-bound O-acyltransferase family protein [Sphaerochaeta sp.]
MLFNSIDFAIFLPIVFTLYWFVTQKNLKFQNLLLVFSSYIFYGWWDWRFLFLILFTSCSDFLISNSLYNREKQWQRKILLILSIFIDFGILGFFKYYNFFQENFVTVFKFFGQEIHGNSLNIILPVGISFYTFQSLSYTLDVYNRKIIPSDSLIDFLAFVSFFPQLVAGPIERATNLLPQFKSQRNFEYDKAVDGMRQILWGLFKKIVIADNCAIYANLVFNNSSTFSGSTLLLGALFFTFQIYGDFSGYSDIAIGTARLFGFNLMRNFATPYFSRDIAEFWRRWHISLSTWFRDYLYIPLGGSRGGKLKNIRNTFIIFIASGFWHGANWTFIVWGALNAIYFLPLLLTNNNRKYLNIVAQQRNIPSVLEFLQIISTFFLTVFAWIFFRAESIGHALGYLSRMFSTSIFSIPVFDGREHAIKIIVILFIFLLIEWKNRMKAHPLENLQYCIEKKLLRWFVYYVLVFGLVFFGTNSQDFIYFQF